MINNNNEQIKPQSAAMELIAIYVDSYAEVCIVVLPRNNHLTWHAHISINVELQVRLCLSHTIIVMSLM